MSRSHGIGLLKLGERSTSYYLSRIRALLGAKTVPVVVNDMNFDLINAHLPNHFSVLEPALRNGLNTLSCCDVVVIPNMTLHETFDRLPAPRAAVPVIHPVDETLAHLKSVQIDHVVVLGSAHTMTSTYWANALKSISVKPMPVSEKAIALVDAFRLKVYTRTETPEDINHFRDCVLELSRICPVIIACTELSIFTVRNEPNVFDAAEIQIDAAINRVANSIA
ncbi:aspartate/glutamate racemase family protein [Robiginitomaculum antarcticum]|uniref:aspartate/glutamate racemase family protein n=1 Tax=Robiginitomaculum antarcticum TaxID=437507 RepID=UPI00037104A0|nr:aspartate/glutamate racemase family protein [Robiginitomaculum antarcticum]